VVIAGLPEGAIRFFFDNRITDMETKRRVGMKPLIALLFFLLAVGTVNAQAMTGNEYLRGDKSFQLGFAVGNWEGTNLGKSYAQSKGINLDALVECADHWERIQLQAVIDQYIKNNPHRWDEPMYKLIIDAVDDACRKRKR
jgi:hypothetical protein